MENKDTKSDKCSGYLCYMEYVCNECGTVHNFESYNRGMSAEMPCVGCGKVFSFTITEKS
jgi:acetone carboxylase gamma subunit